MVDGSAVDVVVQSLVVRHHDSIRVLKHGKVAWSPHDEIELTGKRFKSRHSRPDPVPKRAVPSS